MGGNITAGQSGPCVFKMPQYYPPNKNGAVFHSTPTLEGTRCASRCIPQWVWWRCRYSWSCLSGCLSDERKEWWHPATALHRRGHLHTAQPTGRWESLHTFSFISTKWWGKQEGSVSSEMVTTGYGWSKFISHDQLDHNADQNCHYLKDDCLYFRFKVQAAKPTKL